MARIFSAKSPKTAQRACFVGCIGTLIVGIPFSLVALAAPTILENVGVTPDPDGSILYALLDIVPPALALLVIVAVLSASLSTGDGAILGTASVIAHNIFGINAGDQNAAGDRLLLITRSTSFVMAVLGVFFAVRVPETGVLLLLAFDLGFAGLVVPLAGGIYWSKSTWQGAMSCIILGSLTRLIFFVLMPTAFGIDNTLLYIDNNIFTENFDGFPTLISPLVGLAAFVIISNLTGGNRDTRRRVRTQETEVSMYRR